MTFAIVDHNPTAPGAEDFIQKVFAWLESEPEPKVEASEASGFSDAEECVECEAFSLIDQALAEMGEEILAEPVPCRLLQAVLTAEFIDRR